VSEQTIEAPPVDVSDAPSRPYTPGRTSPIELIKRYPWVAGAIGLLIISLFVVLWARTRPGYDPYGWLVWGKLTIHLKLDTNGAPSWKPLPFLFTVPYALVGHYALWLWMVTSVAISLSAPIFAYRIAFQLTGSDPARRYASYLAGLFAGGLVLLMHDPLGYTYTHYLLSVESDTMIVAICLAAIDCHLNDRHKLAFWLWWLGSLGRPEVWPFWVLAGAWLWRTHPEYKRWLITSAVLLVFLWFGIPGITSKSLLTAGNIAENSPRAIHGNKIVGVVNRFHELVANPVWVAALITLGLAAYRKQRAMLLLAAGALLWVLIEMAFALHGFPAVPRYMFEAAAIVCVFAGVFVGRVVLEVPPLISRFVRSLRPDWFRPALAGKLGAWGAVLVVAVFAGSMLPNAHKQLSLERKDLTQQRERTQEIGRLSVVVQKLGASRLLACGQPNIPIEYQSVLAWYMGVKTGILYVFRPSFHKHPHPLINIYPLSDGWIVFVSHANTAKTAAQSAACSGLHLTYRS
jgi:hypothetical protein